MLYFESEAELNQEKICAKCNLHLNNPNTDICKTCIYKNVIDSKASNE